MASSSGSPLLFETEEERNTLDAEVEDAMSRARALTGGSSEELPEVGESQIFQSQRRGHARRGSSGVTRRRSPSKEADPRKRLTAAEEEEFVAWYRTTPLCTIRNI